jgi:hypothetical protein
MMDRDEAIEWLAGLFKIEASTIARSLARTGKVRIK